MDLNNVMNGQRVDYKEEVRITIELAQISSRSLQKTNEIGSQTQSAL
jgi:hypothetical protein